MNETGKIHNLIRITNPNN